MHGVTLKINRTKKNRLPFWCESSKSLFGAILFAIIDFILLVFYKPDSIVSLLLAYLLVETVNIFSTRVSTRFISLTYFITAFLGIIMVFSLQSIYPSFYGMTDSSATGTDDLFFYIQGTQNYKNGVTELPNLRPDAYYRGLHSYSIVLQAWNWILHRLVRVYPIDFVFFNVIGISVASAEMGKLVSHIFDDDRLVSGAILLQMFCPFMLSNGLVIVRDAWVACFFIIVTERLWNQNYVRVLPAMGCILFLRVGAILELFFVIWFVLHARGKNMSISMQRLLFLLTIVLGAIVVFRTHSSSFNYYMSTLDGITRTNIIGTGGTDTRSVFYRLPTLLRIPLMTVLYFIMPTFNIGTFYIDKVFIFRNFIYALFGILNLYLLPNFIKGLWYSVKYNIRSIKTLGICFIVMMAIVSQVAQVARHKTGFVFIYYIVAIYGTRHFSKLSKIVGNVAGVLLAGFYLFSLI